MPSGPGDLFLEENLIASITSLVLIGEKTLKDSQGGPEEDIKEEILLCG